MIVGLLMFAPAILIGWCLVRALFASPGPSYWWESVFDLSLGSALGVGVVSMLFFVLLWAGITGRTVVVTMEVALAAGGLWLALRRRAPKAETKPARSSAWIWLLRAAAALALLFFAVDAAKSVEADPHGGWDAFTIWNAKAKFLAGGEGLWRNALAPLNGGALFGANHPGYPLMLPSAVASAWAVQGDSSSATPSALGLLFTFASAAILFGAVAYLRGEAAGLMALLLLVSSEGFASQAGSQNADIPISLFLLATMALIALAGEREWPPGTLVLAGLCCGLAAWTKNEGLPFAILALAVVLWKAGIKAAGWMALGALPGAILFGALKILLVTDVEGLFPKTLAGAIARITDASRWGRVLESFGQNIWQMGVPWAHPILLAAVLAVALGLAPRAVLRKQLWLAIPLLGLLAADFGAYLLTTAELSWQLSTSNLRLLVQVWPALLLFTFLLIAPPALPAAPALELPKPARGKTERKRTKGAGVAHAK